MELPNTLRDLFILAFAPATLGALASFLQTNWAWFAALDSGKKALFISGLAVVFGAAYYTVTQVIDPAWFAQMDNFYKAFSPFLVFILGQWLFHSKVTNAGANKTITMTTDTSSVTSSTSTGPAFSNNIAAPAPNTTTMTMTSTPASALAPVEPLQPVPPAPPVIEGAEG